MLYTDHIYSVTKRYFIESKNFGALVLNIFLHFSGMTDINKDFLSLNSLSIADY